MDKLAHEKCMYVCIFAFMNVCVYVCRGVGVGAAGEAVAAPIFVLICNYLLLLSIQSFVWPK